MTAPVEAAAGAAAEVIETVVDNTGKVLAYVATLAGAALAVGWLVRRYGESSMQAADQAGLLTPPHLAPVHHLYANGADDQAATDGDDYPEVEAYEAPEPYGDTTAVGGEWTR